MANKDNFVIEDLKVSPGTIQAIHDKQKKSCVAVWRTIRKQIGGDCTTCQGIPSKKISYDISGAKFVEWYCDQCFQKTKSELNKRLQNMNFS